MYLDMAFYILPSEVVDYEYKEEYTNTIIDTITTRGRKN